MRALDVAFDFWGRGLVGGWPGGRSSGTTWKVLQPHQLPSTSTVTSGITLNAKPRLALSGCLIWVLTGMSVLNGSEWAAMASKTGSPLVRGKSTALPFL